ncbi:secretin N-terminal domain-containing protein [Planctomycetota bacterium]
MMTKQRCSHGGYNWIFALTAALLIFNNCLFAVEQTGVSKEPEYIIYRLEHISIEQGKKYLAEVMTGTVTHPFPMAPALLVTAEPHELTKAKAILDLVDGPEQFVVKAILPVSAARNIPSNKQIAAKLNPSLTRGISIGSFSNPPQKDANTKAIIDIHNDAVIAIVPVRLLDKIVSVIGQLQNSGRLTAQDKPESPDKRKASALAEPGEARFLFTASGEVKTDPNSDETVVRRETPESSVDNQDEDTSSLANGEQVIDLALAERQKLTIMEFLGMVGPYLGLTFMFDEKDVTDEVTINPNGKFRGPIKVKDLYPLLEEVLKFKNLAMTRGEGNFVTIAPAANILDMDPALLQTQEDKIELGDGIVQRVVILEHIDTTTAQNLLTGMKLTTSITAVPETKTLILTGYAYRMPRIQTLLDIVDKPGELKQFRFRQLQYTMAETLAPKIQSLAEQLGTISITVAASAAPTPTRPITPKRANETAAQYQARVRQAQQAAAARQRASAARTPTTGQQPASTQPTVYLDADERTNRILMVGLDKQLDDVEELISTLDVVQQDLRSLEIYKINHVDAEDVKRQLEELGIISPRMTSPYSSRLTTGAKSPTSTSPSAAASRQSTLSRTQRTDYTEAPTEEPQVIVVEPTNSILVNATAEQHVEIAEIISYVDAETDKEEIRYKLYPLENQSPDHLAEILMPLIEESTFDKEGKVESVRQKQEDQITIVPDPNTFSLIVNASKKNQEWISNLIEQLDKRRPQVLIDVTLVEISESDVFDYDLQLVTKLPRFDESGGGQTDVLRPVYSDANNSGFPGNQITELGAFIGESLSGQGFYGDTHIQALLTLMQKKGYGRVLAKPKILVNDNELGHIDATNTIYVSRSSSSATTTGEAVVSSSYTFDEFPSGIQLDITPHISKGALLRLEINMIRSSQGTPTGGENVPPPPKIENNIETTVTVPDKSTIILGGIIQLDQQKQTWKVPLLGDIPIVGGLFRKIGNSSNDTRLYIFVKGEILRPDETLAGLPDLEEISERNKLAFEEFENKFQSYKSWPGVKSKRMDPPKVLEVDAPRMDPNSVIDFEAQ